MRRRVAVMTGSLVALLLVACGSTPKAELASRPAAAGDALANLFQPPPASVLTPIVVAPVPIPIPAGAAAEVAAELAAQAPPPPPPPGIGVGARGALVRTLEQKLASLHYFVGAVDDTYDEDTRDAVMAFQKVVGFDRNGRATDDVVAAINSAKEPPKPLVAAGGFKRVEIDLDRQVLFLYEGNNLALILPVSTGSGERFCSEGWCRNAVTNTGSFAVYDQRSGWEKSPLGWLYNSQYFDGGIAIHGSQSVPGYPASHGCVRIPMSAAEWFPDRLSIGTPVYVVAAGEPVPQPYVAPGAAAIQVTTPTTKAPAPSTTTTVPNLLGLLFGTTTTVPR